VLNAEGPVVGRDCEIVDCRIGRFTEVGEGTRMLNSSLGDYSYVERYGDIANAEIGKFANIARGKK